MCLISVKLNATLLKLMNLLLDQVKPNAEALRTSFLVADPFATPTLFGSGSPGGKVSDLFSARPILERFGLAIPATLAITTQSDSDFRLHKDALIAEIFKRWTNSWIALRSSRADEHQGNGIYLTEFIRPELPVHTAQRISSGNSDRLSDFIDRIRRSASSSVAVAFRKRQGIETSSTNDHMAIAAQPVIGQDLGTCFAPVLSGCGHITHHGIFDMEVVAGLGTGLVSDRYGFKIGKELPSEASLKKAIAAQVLMHGFHENGLASQLRIPEKLLELVSLAPIAQIFQAAEVLRQEGKNYYFEWAWAPELSPNPIITQWHPYEDKPREALVAVENKEALFTAQSTDFANHGRAECQIIVRIPRWNADTCSDMRALNAELRDYLLVLPQEAMTTCQPYHEMSAGQPILFDQFSNCKALVELARPQTTPEEFAHMTFAAGGYSTDHTKGNVGNRHFLSQCDQTDILYTCVRETRFNWPEADATKAEILIYAQPGTVTNDTHAGQSTVQLFTDPSKLIAAKWSNRKVAIINDSIESAWFKVAHEFVPGQSHPLKDAVDFGILVSLATTRLTKFTLEKHSPFAISGLFYGELEGLGDCEEQAGGSPKNILRKVLSPEEVREIQSLFANQDWGTFRDSDRDLNLLPQRLITLGQIAYCKVLRDLLENHLEKFEEMLNDPSVHLGRFHQASRVVDYLLDSYNHWRKELWGN